MQTPDNDFPYTSDDPSLAPVEGGDVVLHLTSQQLDDLRATLRLAVGSALNGGDAYLLRLRRMQAAAETIDPEMVIFDENESFREQLKHLLLGMLFETPDLLQRGLTTVEDVSSKVYGLFSLVTSPITNSWLFSPVRARYERVKARRRQVLNRLIMKGRAEEQNSRLMLQQKALDDLVNELLEYVILKTEVMQIVQEGGVDVAGGALDELRDQSANVDSIMSEKLRSIFKKSGPSQPATSSSNPAEGG